MAAAQAVVGAPVAEAAQAATGSSPQATSAGIGGTGMGAGIGGTGMGTGKGTGTGAGAGAGAAASASLKLTTSCRTLLPTTSLPPAAVHASVAADSEPKI